ncbi:MAG: class I SAM-dependent methyltransferase [Gammaproteobacteria bacterium]|nr:MAG: class I SAM-dependent methyltransferase [Gammaproteobacteria bacterium]
MINDASTQWLVQNIIQHASTQSLWLSDENVLKHLPDAKVWQHKPLFVTNRWDLAQHAKQFGFNAEFNDFDLTAISDNSVDHVFYRVSKEKAVVHHLINEAQRILKSDGILWICGQKNEGIKTYVEKASALFNCAKDIQKDGTNYSSQLVKGNSSDNILDDENYRELRPCINLADTILVSKPGQFGWNKIDLGSEFLIAEVRKLLSGQSKNFQQCLDLGCGYGYLTIASRDFSVKNRTLTDNNAAALITAKVNCVQLKIEAEIIPTDAGKELQGKFDLILCNPPFHQGFSVDGDLTEKFLRNAHRLLTENGVAYFVVNQFIPLEKKAPEFFDHVNLISRNKSFCVFELRKN